MKRKMIFLVGILGVIILVGLGTQLLNRKPTVGVLKITAKPDSTIFLDNKQIGKTSYEEKMATGEYVVKLVPESIVSQLASWQGTVKVSSNLLTYISANLAESEFGTAVDLLWLEKISSRQSELSITTDPDGASVELDGDRKGTTPLSIPNVPQGDHALVVSSPGFLTRTIRVKTTAGYKVYAQLKLALSSAGSPPESPPASAAATPIPTAAVGTPTPSAAASTLKKPYVIIKDTPTGYLRVRMEPNTTASEAARVEPGQQFALVESQGDWYRIRYEGTKEGWISGQYAEKVE